MRKANLGPFKGVSGRRLQERYGGTMREKVREKVRDPDLGPFRGVCGQRLQ